MRNSDLFRKASVNKLHELEDSLQLKNRLPIFTWLLILVGIGLVLLAGIYHLKL